MNERARDDNDDDDGDDDDDDDDDYDDDDDMDKRLRKGRNTADSGGDDVNAALMGKWFTWLQLPVIGFNSGRYHLNTIKIFVVPLLIRNNAAVIKRQNNFMCLFTDKLKFVDIINYLAPGFS